MILPAALFHQPVPSQMSYVASTVLALHGNGGNTPRLNGFALCVGRRPQDSQNTRANYNPYRAVRFRVAHAWRTYVECIACFLVMRTLITTDTQHIVRFLILQAWNILARSMTLAYQICRPRTTDFDACIYCIAERCNCLPFPRLFA